MGLWTLVLIMALFVIRESYSHLPIADMIPQRMLEQAMVVAAVAVVAGVALRAFEKTARVVSKGKSRCQVCNKPVPQGAIYCREHLRSMLEREDKRTHSGTTRPGSTRPGL
jgi:predicted nucleic acid-binding Zn ribbon protein